MLLGVKGGTNFCDVCYEKSFYACSGKTFCKECCTKFHQHPDHHDHTPCLLSDLSDDVPELSCNELEDNQLDYNVPDSQDDETERLFKDTVMVATLAERFDSTQFQKEIISNVLSGRDTLVVQPTGSGKSLCFEFPPKEDNYCCANYVSYGRSLP